MASPKPKIAVAFFLIFIARCISEETCKKVDTCSCKFKNGSIVNLRPEDGGKGHPKFTNIQEESGRTFEWNPCSTFSTGTGCKNVLSCQIVGTSQFPAGTEDTTFSVDSEGNVVIKYGKIKGSDKNVRQTEITLKCDPTTNGTKPEKFTGTGTSFTVYSGTFNSKYCCAMGGSSGGLSAGSILLIIFFPLLLMYFIIGILVNRYGRGIESMPELIPNYSFWADVPFLVKDGFVFTYDRIKTTCAGKCGKSGYAEI